MKGREEKKIVNKKRKFKSAFIFKNINFPKKAHLVHFPQSHTPLFIWGCRKNFKKIFIFGL